MRDARPDDRPNAVHLVRDRAGRLQPVPLTSAWAVWCGVSTTRDWPIDPAAGDATLLTVLRRGLAVVCGFVMRVPLKNQRVDRGAARRIWDEARQTTLPAATATRRRHNRKIVAKHQEHLPADWRTQLAVYFDAPACHFDELLVGGPLLMATHCRLSLGEVVEHLADESN